MLTYTNTNEKISLVPFASPVFVQGVEGDCTACAAYNMTSMISNIAGRSFAMNVQTFYNMEEIAQGTPGQDIGVAADSVMPYLQNIGVTESTAIPYGPQSMSITPPAADYADAARHTVMSWHKLPLDMSPQIVAWEIAAELIQGKPVMMGMSVEEWFMTETGALSAQPGKYIAGVNSDRVMGGHMVVIDGINTVTGDITVASWGPDCGDQGYYKINLAALAHQPYVGGSGPGGFMGLYVADGFDGIDLTQNATTKAVAEAFNAMVDRAPEHSAMVNCAAYLADGHTLANLCDLFTNSAEFKAALPANATNEQIASHLYSTILGRAPDAGGLSFWTGALNNGTSIGTVAAGMIHDIEASQYWVADSYHHMFTGTDMALRSESLRLNNRAQASEDYAIAMQAGDEYGAEAHDLLTHITDDPDTIIITLSGIGEQIGHNHIVSPVLG